MGAEAVVSTNKPQAISGVSADSENVVMSVWPSIAATGLGRGMGRLYESIPLKINGIKLSNLLFTLPTVPIALPMYLFMKVFGEQYVLTNRSVQRRTSLTSKPIKQAALTDIHTIAVVQQRGQEFYRASDLELYDAAGNLLLRLEGIPWAEVFRQTILKARDARLRVTASLATINARHAQ